MIRAIFSLLFISLLGCSPQESRKEKPTATVPLPVVESGIEILAQSKSDTLKGSLKAMAKGRIGTTQFQIDYYSPAVRDRIVWGGLVPYDKVWVAGAHMATSIEFDKELMISNISIPAGKYALFAIPGKTEWTVIINKNWKQHLADNYDPKEDLVRVNAKAEVQELNQERLRYTIESTGVNQGKINFEWEKIKISMPIRIDN